MGTVVADMSAEATLHCPHCRYDLRGATGDVCPECGKTFDPATLGKPEIPWNDRHRWWSIRSFIATVWLVLRHPILFARQIDTPVSLKPAKRFRLICVLLAAGCLVPMVWRTAWQFYPAAMQDPLLEDVANWQRDDPPEWDDFVGWPELIADTSIIAALCLGTGLWLFLGSGLATYALETRERHAPTRERRLAIGYYTAAPLALSPLIVFMLGIDYVAHFRGFSSSQYPGETLWEYILLTAKFFLSPFKGPLDIAIAFLIPTTICVQLLYVCTLPYVALVRGLDVGIFRSFAIVPSLIAGWLVLLIPLVLGLPFLAFYLQIAWHALDNLR
ncbi:MAG: hypothetical protein AAGI46_00715 [Planctomycetota bacterium]